MDYYRNGAETANGDTHRPRRKIPPRQALLFSVIARASPAWLTAPGP